MTKNLENTLAEAKKLGYNKDVLIKSIYGNTKGKIIGDPYICQEQPQYIKTRVKATFGEELTFIIYDSISNKWAEKI